MAGTVCWVDMNLSFNRFLEICYIMKQGILRMIQIPV